MRETKRHALILAILAAGSVAGCNGGGGASKSGSASTAPGTTLPTVPVPTMPAATGSGTTANPTTSSTSTPPAPVSTSSTTTPVTSTATTAPVTTGGHGVVEFRTVPGSGQAVVIVRDDDYAEFEVVNPALLRAQNIQDGRTLVWSGDLGSVSTTAGTVALNLTTFSADEADLHGKLKLLRTMIGPIGPIGPVGPIHPFPPIGPIIPRPPIFPRPVFVFEADGGDRYKLTGTLAPKCHGTANATLWRGVRVTGQVKLAPTLTAPGEIELTSFAFDRVVEHNVAGGLLGLRQNLLVDTGTRYGTYLRSTVFSPIVERREGPLTRAQIRKLDKLVKAADVFAKPDVYPQTIPVWDIPVTKLVYRTVQKEKTITIHYPTRIPAELDAVLREMAAIVPLLPRI